MKLDSQNFIKCYSCKIKPATMKCLNCAYKYPGETAAKYCYSCDSEIHGKIKEFHRK